LDLANATAQDITSHIPDQAIPVGIIGGPPCQGFSQGNTQRGPEDPRNQLAKNYTKIIDELAVLYPLEFFVFENVSGLMADENKKILKSLQTTLSKRFHVFSACLNAKDYGVPQSRERFFMVGLRKHDDVVPDFAFPSPVEGQQITVRNAIEGLPEATYYQRNLSADQIPHHPNHWTMRPKSPRFGPDLVSRGRSMIRLEWDKPSRTVAYGHREIHVHPSGTRRLTILEAMLLQGFPKEYKLCGTLSNQVTQVSNAVPPPLAKAIAEQIKLYLANMNKGMTSHGKHPKRS
jgi:DNA (cytosine-5)-methyltransferase 1